MTVIASFMNHGNPFLLSDMLLSREAGIGLDPRVFLPTLGRIDLVAKEYGSARLKSSPTRMVRKVFAVGDRLHVAWAGSVSSGVALRRSLIELLDSEMPPEEAFEEAIARLPIEQQSELAVIGVYEVNNESELLTYGCREVQSRRWGRCCFGGSGAEALEREVVALDECLPVPLPADPAGLSAEQWCARLIYSETCLLDPGNQYPELLQLGCGGFYESLRFSQGVLQNPRTVAYLNVDIGEAGEPVKITRLYLYSTAVSDVGGGRTSVVLSLVENPVVLDFSSDYFEFESAECDVVVCPPFWRDGDKSQLHGGLLNDLNLIEKCADIEAISLCLFGGGGIRSMSEIKHFPLELQQSLLERNPSGVRKFSMHEVDVREPQLQFAQKGCNCAVQVKIDWIKAAIAKLEADRAGGTVVASIRSDDRR